MNLPKKKKIMIYAEKEHDLDDYEEIVLDSEGMKQLADCLQEAEDELKIIRSIYENIYDPEEGLTDEAEELLNTRIEKIDVIHEKAIKFLRGE